MARRDQMPSLKPVLYDARGNRYVVASPDQIPDCPCDVTAAAAERAVWAGGAIANLCHADGGAEAFSDGLIVGPFEAAPPFHALIVNTDGSLAERSGNGLTILAQALRDVGIVAAGERFDILVHHATPGQPSPVAATLAVADDQETTGVWVGMGQPAFGPDCVGASAAIAATSTPRRDTNHVAELADINALWTDSVLVRIGNPHCVTWIGDEGDLPSFDALGEATLFSPLKSIAFANLNGCTAMRAFAHGINLQWATRLGPDRLAARIFERGEGPTRSSGSSATAVACAARQVRLVEADVVHVEMPGGVAQVRFAACDDDGFTADYLGIAERVG